MSSSSPALSNHSPNQAAGASSSCWTTSNRALLTSRGYRSVLRSNDGEHAGPLELRDLLAVLLPLGLLVAEEEVENVLAERLGDELGVLHDSDRVVQVLRKRRDPEQPPLRLGQ